MSEKTYGRDEIVALLDGSMSNLPRDIEERDSGLWLIAIDDDALRDLTDTERDALPKHPNARPTTEPLLRFPEFNIREFLAFENCVHIFREHYLEADVTWERIPEEPRRKPESGDASVDSNAKAGDDEAGDDAKQKASDDAGKPVEYRRFVKSFRWTGVIDERVASLKVRSPHAVELVMALLGTADHAENVEPAALTEPPSTVAVERTPTNSAIHRIVKRTNKLNAVLKLALKEAVDPDDWLSVWASLVKLAESKDRPSPLVGFVPNEGIKYDSVEGEEGIAFLTQEAFRSRFRRYGKRA